MVNKGWLKLQVIVVALMIAAPAFGALNYPPRPLPELLAGADTVVVGEATNATVESPETLVLDGAPMPMLGSTVTFRVDQVIKGSPPQQIQVRSWRFNHDGPHGTLLIGGTGRTLRLRVETPPKRVIIFLDRVKDKKDLYQFHDLNSPVLWVPVRPTEAVPKGADASTLMQREFRAGAQSEDPATQIASLRWLGELGSVDKATRKVLEKRSRDDNLDVRAIALGARLALGDEDALGAAVDLLTAGEAFDRLQWELAKTIKARVRRPESVSALLKLAKSDALVCREASVYALWQIGSPAAVACFKDALNDADMSVRYYAVQGLYKVLKGPNVASPTFQQFEADPEAYVKGWQTQ